MVVHLHGWVTDGVFARRVEGNGVTFHAARPLTASDLVAVTQWVRLRLVRWFRRKGFLSREAAADMLIWEHSGFSVDASVRISLADRDVPGTSRAWSTCCVTAPGRRLRSIGFRLCRARATALSGFATPCPGTSAGAGLAPDVHEGRRGPGPVVSLN